MLPESKTVNKLLTLVGRGGTHVSVAHDIAQTVRNDGLENPTLAAFTSCGTFGLNDQNTERDMQRWLRGLWGFELEPYEIKLQLQVRLVKRICSYKFPRFFLTSSHYSLNSDLPPIKVNYSDQPVEVPAWVLLPHEVLHSLSQWRHQASLFLKFGSQKFCVTNIRLDMGSL